MPLISSNVDLLPPHPVSPWRKVAIGTWHGPGDPSVYGMLDVDVEKALEYIERLRAESGQKVTITHFVGRAFAEAIGRHPQINSVLRFGRIYRRKSVDIFFQIASDTKGEDLAGHIVRETDRKSIPDIARELNERVIAIRAKGDAAFKKMKGLMGLIPGFLARPMLRVSGFLMYSLNFWSPLLGSPRDAFGSLMLTNIGSLGLDMALAPLVPYSRVPIVVVVGAVREVPIVRDGKVVVAKVMGLSATFDHRLIDGMHASHLVTTLRKIFANPEVELKPRA